MSDITIADCWGWQQMAPDMFDDKGLSSVVVHSEKGKALFDAVSPQLAFKKVPIEGIKTGNPNYIRSRPFDHKRRSAFWADYLRHEMPFRQLLDKHLGESRTARIKKSASKYLAPLKKIAKLFLNISLDRIKRSQEMIAADKRFNETFRFNGKAMPGSFKRQPEWRFITAYRRFQANRDNAIGLYYRRKLLRIERKTGIHIENNPNLGRGLIIGHYGRIIINGCVRFGEQIYITHGVTIGRNATGKRKGVPTFGNRVRIGANACIVGNVRIGDDVMIAPNAFVNVDVPDHSVVAGNPCTIHHKDNATKGYIGEL